MSEFITQNSIKTYKLQCTPALTDAQDVKEKKKAEQEQQIFNTQNSDATNVQKTQKAQKREPVDTDALYKKYKKNPDGIVDELFKNYSEEDRNTLKELIDSKKDLKSFLNLVKQDSLTKDDLIEGMKKVKEKKSSGFFKRVGNVIKKAFTDGISEAIDLAKSEKVYYSEKLSETMDEIREVRKDFSSEGLANISDKVAEKPEIKETTMHFVKKEEIAGKKLYDEESVAQATEIVYEKPEDKEVFLKNAIELESIKDENGNIKYKGSTIVDVDKKMIDNKELQPTMMKTAKKSDMTDDYLTGITDNLIKNPKMENAINDFLDAKNDKGKDAFSAENLLNQSKYMVNKDDKTIQNYTENTLELLRNKLISSDDIVSNAEKITDNPNLKQQVLSSLQNKNKEQFSFVTGSENTNTTQASATFNYTISETSANEAQNIQNQTEKQYQYVSTPSSFSYTKTNLNNQESKEKITYTEADIVNFLYKKFGDSADGILKQIKSNPSFGSMLKKYYGNPEVVAALAKDPQLVTKITQASSSITNTQLSQILRECTSTEKTEMMIKLINQFGPQKAITMANHTKKINDNKRVIELLEKTTIDSSQKKEALENENEFGLNRNFVA